MTYMMPSRTRPDQIRSDQIKPIVSALAANKD
jgi:hypothetical protein